MTDDPFDVFRGESADVDGTAGAADTAAPAPAADDSAPAADDSGGKTRKTRKARKARTPAAPAEVDGPREARRRRMAERVRKARSGER